MRLRNSQLGISKLSLLILLAVVAFFLLCAFRMIPVYMDDRYIQSALQSLEDDVATINDMSDRDIRRKISNFYMVNNVRNHTANELEITRDPDGVVVSMIYEVRLPLIYNIDVVMSFENEWDSSRPDECCKPLSE